MSYDNRQFYIDGQWVNPVEPQTFEVINPATEAVAGVISMGGAADVDLAVAAARRAFDSYSRTTVAERIALLERVLEAFNRHHEAMAQAISTEMGAPITLARNAQAPCGPGTISGMIDVLREFPFEEVHDRTRLVQEAVGVCALITPWNWPINQIAAKVVPALAAGCTMVLKPSEYAPLSALLWTQIMHEAGVPAGVFNMIIGDGLKVGAPLASHPDVDMVSFTGSTRAGSAVARSAADTVKRVHQELGGKSPNIVLEDADFERAVTKGMVHVMRNTGQSCNAPTRMLVPASRLAEAEAIAARVAASAVVGDPGSEKTTMGPVVSKIQFERVTALIEAGIAEGAKLVAGGSARPAGLERGYYVQPTVFSGVNNQMRIAREEIFGPVLCILPYASEEDAIRIANDTPYGLAGYVWSKDTAHAQRVGRRIRAGQISINGASGDYKTPFGGFKMSGNGREFGEYGLRDFLEVKAVIGVDAA